MLYLHTELAGRSIRERTCRRCSRSSGVDEEAVLVVDQSRYLFNPFTPEEMAAIYSTLDVLLNASMGEGFGLTVLEAQACGVPAIVTDFTAMSEVCGAGWKVGYDRLWTDQASWQARPHVEEIVESLEECYRLDEQSRRELSARAREHALAYDADRVLTEHWLPALERDRGAAARPGAPAPAPAEASRGRCRWRSLGTGGSVIAPICVPVLMISRKGCALVIALADDVEQEPARDRPGGRRRARDRKLAAGGHRPALVEPVRALRRLVLRDAGPGRATARAGSRARSAGPCPGCGCRS